MKNLKWFGIVLLSLMLLSCTTAKERTELSKIEIAGNGEVKVKPDIAVFSISLQSTQPTTEEAVTELKSLQARVLDVLVNENKIKDEDIVSSYLNFEPEYSWEDNKRNLIGQRAYASYEVTVRSLENLGAIYDSLSKISTITLSNITLKVADESTYRTEARKKAVDNAITIASLYAKELGMELKRALYVSEQNSGYYNYRAMPFPLAAKAMGDNATEAAIDYRQDDVTVSANVNVIFELK